MKEFVIYRHGRDDLNQSADRGLPEKMAVARVRAADPDAACRLARPDVTLYDGQSLSAEPADELDAKEANLNRPATVPEELDQS